MSLGLSKENLSKMSVGQLKGKLIQVEGEFLKKSSNIYTPERQEQILKGKTIKGSTKQQKQALISQINKIQNATNKIETITIKINYHADTEFDNAVTAARLKVLRRQEELLKKGLYETHLSAKEKVYYWCDCMGFSRSDLNLLLAVYTFEELAEMSGDEFYDEMQDMKLSYELGKQTYLEENIDEEELKRQAHELYEGEYGDFDFMKQAAEEAVKKGYEGNKKEKYIEKRTQTLREMAEKRAVKGVKKQAERDYKQNFKEELGQNIRKEQFAKPVDERIAELQRIQKKKKRKGIDLTTLL